MIYVTGDTHGLNDVGKFFKFLSNHHLCKKDYVIIAGDFGGIWYGTDRDQDALKFYQDMNCTVLFVDGNHENFDALNRYPMEMWNGGKIHRIANNIIHLMRGQIYDIDGKSFFTFGGGLSIDQMYRIPGVSWWKEEWPTKAEMDEALDNLEAHDNQVDYVITHAAPQWIMRNILCQIHPMSRLHCDTEVFLDEVFNRIKYKMWFCGHYHFDAYVRSEKFYTLYHDIIELSDEYSIVNK